MARLGYTKIRALLTRPTCVLDQSLLLARSRFHSQCSGNDLLLGTSCALLEARRFDDCARRSLSAATQHSDCGTPATGPGFGGRNQNTRDQGAHGGTSSGGRRFILGMCVGVSRRLQRRLLGLLAPAVPDAQRAFGHKRAESAGEVQRKR